MTYLSPNIATITFDVNGLNTPVKRQIGPMATIKCSNYVVTTRTSLQI